MFLWFLLFLLAAIVAVPIAYFSSWPWWLVAASSIVAAFALIKLFDLAVDTLEQAGVIDDDNPDNSDQLIREADTQIINLDQHTRCPACDSGDIAQILYGLPAIDREMERLLKEKKITFGGCAEDDTQPRWLCNQCHHKFG